jgi:hypothetical protein
MRHVEIALNKLKESGNDLTSFISIQNTQDVKGVAPTVSFTIQSDPIKEVGVNGCQAIDMLKYTKFLFESLNDIFPCPENGLSIRAIDEAIFWQEVRTKNRTQRNVEGENLI